MKSFLLALCSALLGLTNGFISPCQIGQITVIDTRTNRTLLTNANCGAILNATDFIEVPQVHLLGAVPGHNYTVILLSTNQTDQKQGTYLHWLVSNIKPNGTALRIQKNTTVLAQYFPPALNVSVGLFKYVFLVYAQKPESYNPWRQISIQERANFSVEHWMHTYPESTFSLRPVGASEFLLKYANRTKGPAKDTHWYVPPAYPSHPSHPKKTSSSSASIVFSGGILFLSAVIGMMS